MTPVEIISNIDGSLFREQRLVLGTIINSGVLSEGVLISLRGLEELLDTIADCVYDQYGIDCLLQEPKEKPMITGNCKYEDGIVESCFDCNCDECTIAITEYEAWLNDKAKEEEYNSIIAAAGACHD